MNNLLFSNCSNIVLAIFCDNSTGTPFQIYSYFSDSSFKHMVEFLINSKENNKYILDDTTDIEILKQIAISNNELILIDNRNIEDIHKKLANRIITIDEFYKQSY